MLIKLFSRVLLINKFENGHMYLKNVCIRSYQKD